MDKLLPPELVSRIFKLALEEDIEAGSTSVHSSGLLLGRVSKRWRDIAYSTPTLWTSVHADVRRAATIPCLMPGIRAWLLRAGALPLSVKLEVSCASWEILQEIASLTAMLLSFSPKIRRLSIWINYLYFRLSSDIRDYIILSDGGFPILETLDIDCSFNPDHPDMVLATMLASAPALRQLSVADYPGTISVLPVPMARLQRLVWGPRELPTTAHDMLRCAPALEECRFWLTPLPLTPPPAVYKIITHHRLRRLHIGRKGLEELLSGLALPALAHLTFDGARLNSPNLWPQPAVVAFLARSRCALGELSFTRVNMAPRDLEACVEMAGPTLKVLCVDGGPKESVGVALLRRMTVGRGHGDGDGVVLCPRLERLRVCQGVLERGGHGIGMLDMLESRFYRNTVGEDRVAWLQSVVVGGGRSVRCRRRG